MCRGSSSLTLSRCGRQRCACRRRCTAPGPWSSSRTQALSRRTCAGGSAVILGLQGGAYLDATVAAPLAGEADLLGLFGAGVHVDCCKIEDTRACVCATRASTTACPNERTTAPGTPQNLASHVLLTYAPLPALASARHTQSHNLLTVFPSSASPCRSGALRRARNHPSPSLNPNPANYCRHVRLIRLALSAVKRCKQL